MTSTAAMTREMPADTTARGAAFALADALAETLNSGDIDRFDAFIADDYVLLEVLQQLGAIPPLG